MDSALINPYNLILRAGGTPARDSDSVQEVIEKAGLDWDISISPVAYLKEGNWAVLPGSRAIIRGDTDAPLGLVGSRYRPLSNMEAFQFLNDFIQDGTILLRGAGSLKGGVNVWLVASLPNHGIVGTDIVANCLLFWNSFDGKSRLSIQLAPIDPKTGCLYTTLPGDVPTVRRITHSSNILVGLTQARQALQVANLRIQTLEEEVYKPLTSTSATDADVEQVLCTALPGSGKEVLSQRMKNVHRVIAEMMASSSKGPTPSLWDLYKAVCQYVDISRGGKVDKRLVSAWLGQGYQIKQAALATAVSLASTKEGE
jgi:phage/plasmid-like protein (TIGR03299 family)